MRTGDPRQTTRLTRHGAFPPGFLWGAASCPAKSEGETVSDWASLSAPDGSVADDGPRHWRRYRYDFRALASLGARAYRFGCDWGRLQREPYAPFSRGEAYRYLEMLAELRSLGVEPWLTLFQHALPRWAAAAGGWRNPETPRQFADFSARLADLTDGEVRRWIPVHEPQIYALVSRMRRLRPGGEEDGFARAVQTMRRLRDGHRLAADAIRKRLPGAKIGLALHGGVFPPRRAWHPGDWLASAAGSWLVNNFGLGGLSPSRGDADFLMLGAGDEIPLSSGRSLSLATGLSPECATSLSLRCEAAGLGAARRLAVLRRWKRRLGIPVYLVGTSFPAAPANREFPRGLRSWLATAAAAADEGLVDGFFYEPLLDEFDPERGLTGGNGLLRVDFRDADRRRDVRPFARMLGKIIRAGEIEDLDLPER